MKKSVYQKLVLTLLGPVPFLFGANALGASDEALLEVLLREGVLTTEQVEEVRAQATVKAEANRSVVSSLRIRGRIQPQFGYVRARNEAGETDEYSTFEMRRVRLGAAGTIGDDWSFLFEANVTPDNVNLQFASLRWRAFPEANIVVGFDRPVFGHEIYTSSAFLLTPERSNLSSTFLPSSRISLTGAQVQGEWEDFTYSAGVYNSEIGTNSAGESSRYLFGGHVGGPLPDLGEATQSFRLDYLQNEKEDSSLLFVNKAAALSHQLEWGALETRSEVMWGESFGGDSVGGFYVMPAWSITDEWQVVARYEWMKADFDDGIRGPGRYIRRVFSDERRGDRFDAVYAGINYYLMGQDMKLQWGLEWSDLRDTRTGSDERLHGVTAIGGARLLF
ncbi:MAG: hypothetical protein JJT75_08530 [Opitutales bacterium]|nr:hypothetical protein [Opitutales bacterium]MCH8539348.1 OprO/OprP family phosphate-selective porin [Opitutales bacterium]